MSDIVERLRGMRHALTLGPYPLTTEAADEIERLRHYHKLAIDRCHELEAEIERLRKQCDEAHDYRVAMERLDAQTIVGLRAEIERLEEKHEALKEEFNDLVAGYMAAKREIERLRALVQDLLDNDPDDDAADGVTVLQVWRKEARRALEEK